MSRLTHILPACAAVSLALAATPAASPAAPSGPVAAADKLYLQTSIEGDRFEIAGGKIAQTHGSTQAVKDYGTRLVKDHSASLKDAVALAKQLGIKVPKAPSPSMQWELQMIDGLSGTSFDQAYADLEAKDHQQDISETSDEVTDGTNALVRKAARGELPTLRAHLKIATRLGGKQGINPTG